MDFWVVKKGKPILSRKVELSCYAHQAHMSDKFELTIPQLSVKKLNQTFFMF
jgi:hypothetical protein